MFSPSPAYFIPLLRRLSSRKWRLFIPSLICAIAPLAGCLPDDSIPTSSPPENSNFKVAMILPATIDDGSWSQSGYEGLQLIQQELGAQVAHTEQAGELSDAEKEKIIEQYALNGFNFIIGHGGEFLNAIEKVAENYPRVKFSATTNCPGNNINQGCLTFRGGELGYLAGVVAALKTKTQKVGFIGGVDYAHMKERAILFERGVKSIDPKIEVKVDWLGSWTDEEKAKKLATQQVESGVDIISISAEPAEESVYSLTSKKDFYLIGWQLDRAPLAPDRVVTSALQDVPKMMLQGAILVEKGRWEGKQYKLGIEDGVQELAPFRGTLAPAEKARVKSITEDILTDEIDVFL
ncbi:MAG: BMP family protein [Cyanobacteriota bacterium]|nr:BMP family protein [Cyanobacteriota bacterium]